MNSFRLTTFVLALLANHITFAADEADTSNYWNSDSSFQTVTDNQTNNVDYLSVHPSGTFWGLGGKTVLGQGQGIWPFGGDGIESIFYGAVEGAATIQKSKGYSLGLGAGYRHIIKNSMLLGGYVMIDYNRSPSSHNFWVANPGFELLNYNWDLRANVYIPTTDQYWLGNETVAENLGMYQYERYSQHNKYDHIFQNYEEVRLGGDFEVGRVIPLPRTHGLRTYIGGYNFAMKRTDTITGIAARVLLPLTSTFTLELRDSYDRPRKNIIMAGVRLTFGGYKLEDRDSLGIAGRLSDPIEHNFGNFAAGTTVPVGKQFIDKGEEQVPGVFWFAKDNGSSTSSGDGTFEHPFTVLDQNAYRALTNSGQESQNVQLYIAGPGTYTIGDPSSNWSWPVTNGFAIYGRSQDFMHQVKPQIMPVLNGAIQLFGNNIIDSIQLQNNALIAAPTIDITNAPNITLSNVGVTTTNAGTNSAIKISGANNITFTGVTVNATESNTSSAGINISSSKNIYFDTVAVTATGAYGSAVSGQTLSGINIADSAVQFINGGSKVSVHGGSQAANGVLASNSQVTLNNSGDNFSVIDGAGANNAVLLKNKSTLTANGTNTVFAAVSSGAAATGLNIASGSSATLAVGGNSISATNTAAGNAYGIAVDGAGSAFTAAVNGNTFAATAKTGIATAINASNNAAVTIGNNSSVSGNATGHSFINLLGLNALMVGDAAHTTFTADAAGGTAYGINASKANLGNIVNAIINVGTSSNTLQATGINLANSSSATINGDTFTVRSSGDSNTATGIALDNSSATVGGVNTINVDSSGGVITGINLAHSASVSSIVNAVFNLGQADKYVPKDVYGIDAENSTLATIQGNTFNVGKSNNIPSGNVYGIYLDQLSSATAITGNTVVAYGTKETDGVWVGDNLATAATLSGNIINIYGGTGSTGSTNGVVGYGALLAIADGNNITVNSSAGLNSGKYANGISALNNLSGGSSVTLSGTNNITVTGADTAAGISVGPYSILDINGKATNISVNGNGTSIAGIAASSATVKEIINTTLNIGTAPNVFPAKAYGIDASGTTIGTIQGNTITVMNNQNGGNAWGIYSASANGTMNLNGSNTINVTSSGAATGVEFDGATSPTSSSSLALNGTNTLTVLGLAGGATGITVNSSGLSISGTTKINVDSSNANVYGLNLLNAKNVSIDHATFNVAQNSTYTPTYTYGIFADANTSMSSISNSTINVGAGQSATQYNGIYSAQLNSDISFSGNTINVNGGGSNEVYGLNILGDQANIHTITMSGNNNITVSGFGTVTGIVLQRSALIVNPSSATGTLTITATTTNSNNSTLNGIWANNATLTLTSATFNINTNRVGNQGYGINLNEASLLNGLDASTINVGGNSQATGVSLTNTKAQPTWIKIGHNSATTFNVDANSNATGLALNTAVLSNIEMVNTALNIGVNSKPTGLSLGIDAKLYTCGSVSSTNFNVTGNTFNVVSQNNNNAYGISQIKVTDPTYLVSGNKWGTILPGKQVTTQ